MKRTFGGWLLRYCCSLTGLETTSVKKLARAVEDHAPQAEEAVFLYALERNQIDPLLKSAHNKDLAKDWKDMAAVSSRFRGRSERFLRKKGASLPMRYQKVLLAYDSIEAEALNDDRVVHLVGQEVNGLLSASGTTRYRLCKELSLNPGNVYAWLAGDSTKVSRSTAMKALEYAEGLDEG